MVVFCAVATNGSRSATTRLVAECFIVKCELCYRNTKVTKNETDSERVKGKQSLDEETKPNKCRGRISLYMLKRSSRCIYGVHHASQGWNAHLPEDDDSCLWTFKSTFSSDVAAARCWYYFYVSRITAHRFSRCSHKLETKQSRRT